jgi:hypothetical protein
MASLATVGYTPGSGVNVPVINGTSGETQIISDGGAYFAVLTPASATTITNLLTQAGTQFAELISIFNASDSPQTVVLTLFDEGASPTGATADQRFQGSLGAGQSILWRMRLINGLSYTLSAACNANIIITGN